jgi:hypothetical protein
MKWHVAFDAALSAAHVAPETLGGSTSLHGFGVPL